MRLVSAADNADAEAAEARNIRRFMSRKYITLTRPVYNFQNSEDRKEETMTLARVWLAVSLAGAACAQTDFDLLIKGGHVIDGKNRISAVRDVAIKDGKIAAVAANIAASRASKTVDAAGL